VRRAEASQRQADSKASQGRKGEAIGLCEASFHLGRHGTLRRAVLSLPRWELKGQGEGVSKIANNAKASYPWRTNVYNDYFGKMFRIS
jgi:hypothetical protein